LRGLARYAWRDIWSEGQGVGAVEATLAAGEWIAARARDYAFARQAMKAEL
jgi:hypothetical protein